MGYDAFISYRHSSDGDIAAAIEQGLERVARPWNRVRAMSVFRDQSDLTAEANLTGAITNALDTTRYFVLVASPQSAASPWVDKEVAYWCDQRGGAAQLILVVTGGEFAWDDEANALSPTTTAVSATVCKRITAEPLYVDLRWARTAPELSLRETRFRSAMVLISATIRGIAPSDLESEDLRLHRRARRLARAAVATVVVLALVASLAAVVAVGNARRADRRARDALARQLGLAALDMPASEVDQAFLLSLVAADLDSDDSGEQFNSSRALIGRYSRLGKLLHAPPGTSSIRGIAISPADGRVVATMPAPNGDTTLLTWSEDTRGDPSMMQLPSGVAATSASFLADGRALVGDTGGEVVMIGADGTTVDEIPGLLAVDSESDVGVRPTSSGAEVFDLATDERRASMSTQRSPTHVDIRHGRVVMASDDELVVIAEAGTVAQTSAGSFDGVAAIAAGPSDDIAALTASDGEVVPWRADGDVLEAGEAVAVPEGVGRPQRMVVAADGARALVVGSGGTAIVNLATGITESTGLGATGRLSVDPSATYAAVGGARLTIWDLSAGRPRFAVPFLINAMAWSGPCDDDTPCKLATAGESIDVWEPARLRRLELADQTNAQAVAFSADGSTVVTAGWGGTVAVWQTRPIVESARRSALSTAGNPASVDPADGSVARFDGGETVEVTGSSTATVGTGPVDELTLAGGGTRLITASAGELALWDVSRGESIDLDRRCTGDLRAVSPGGDYLATYRVDSGTTTVCATDDGEMVASARMRFLASSPAVQIAVDDDGSVALGGTAGFVEYFPRDGGAFVDGAAIDVRTGGEPVEVTSLAARDGVVAAGVGPLATGAAARVLIWPVEAGGTPTHFETDYADVAFVSLLGPAAEQVAVAGRDLADGPVTIRIWETASRRRVGRALDGLSGDIVSLGGDDTGVVAADAAGRAYRWELDRDPTTEICDIVGRPLTVDEWESLADGALSRYAPRPVCPG